MPRKKKQATKNYLSFPFSPVYLILALSLLVNVALASFVLYVHSNPQADLALINYGTSRACGSDYQYYLDSFKTNIARTNFAHLFCNRAYLAK